MRREIKLGHYRLKRLVESGEACQRDVWPPRPYYLFGIVSPLLAFFCYWLVSAFFFGYFYVSFRGHSGLRKGAVVSLAVILSLLPVWLLSSPAPLAIFFRTGQWKKLMQFEEIKNFAAFATIILTSVGASIQTALANRADLIVTNLVDLAFQQLPKMPPLP